MLKTFTMFLIVTLVLFGAAFAVGHASVMKQQGTIGDKLTIEMLQANRGDAPVQCSIPVKPEELSGYLYPLGANRLFEAHTLEQDAVTD